MNWQDYIVSDKQVLLGKPKEPKGVDFIIKSEPLTDDERAAISEFIRQYKLKHTDKKIPVKKKARTANNIDYKK